MTWLATQLVESNEICVLLKHPPAAWYHITSVVDHVLEPGRPRYNAATEAPLLFEAMRDQEFAVIRPAIRSGQYVLVHRYVYCMLAYYIAIGDSDIDSGEAMLSALLRPDITIYPRITATGFRRRNRKLLPYQAEPGAIDRLIQGYDFLASKYGFVTLDSELCSVAECGNRIWERLDQVDRSLDPTSISGGMVNIGEM